MASSLTVALTVLSGTIFTLDNIEFTKYSTESLSISSSTEVLFKSCSSTGGISFVNYIIGF